MDNKLIGNEKNILFYNDEEGSTCSKMEHMGNKGKQVYNTKYYNLDMIISIGFRVNSKKENMGLNTWENSHDGKTFKSDVIIAKNYLNEQEIKNLNNLVNLFLDIAENNAERSITMYMEDWKNEVENALKVFHYEVLEGKGKISHKQAVEKAENEYEKYKVIQDKNYVSDFDRLLSETKQIENK